MSLLERYATPLQVVITVGLYIQIAALGGIATAPGVYVALRAWGATAGWSPPARVLVGCCLGWGVYFSYAICVVFVVGAFRVVTRAGAPLGTFPYYSFQAVRWASYNALILLVRYTTMNFIRVTPFLTLFHRFMGMRIGRRVQINTLIIGGRWPPDLITPGSYLPRFAITVCVPIIFPSSVVSETTKCTGPWSNEP